MSTRFAGLTLAIALFVTPLMASEDAIRSVISQQVEAMRVDDFGAAFNHASPAIKNIFQTPERFGQMVQQGYPMVYQPREIRFLELREVAGRLWQRVMVTDAAGKLHMLDYQMIETPQGWQINGVQLLKAPDLNA